jgi:outer membrane protein assembly factor BamB
VDKSPHLRLFVVLLFLASLGVTPLLAAPTPTWSYTATSDIKWFKLAPTGHLIVSTDGALLGVDPESGQPAWTSEELKDLDEEKFDIVEGTQFAVITKGKGVFGSKTLLILLDLSTGKEAWTTESIGMTGNNGHFLLMETSAMLLYGPTGKNANDRDMLVVDLGTGKEIWRNEEFFKKFKPELVASGKTKMTLTGNQMPLFDSDETMIVFWSKDGIRKLNAKTGAILWTTPLKCDRAPANAYGFGNMMLNDDKSVLFAPYEKTLVAVSTKDGSLLWKKPPQLKGQVYQMDLTPDGLVVKGGPNSEGKDGDNFITVLDPATGDVKWKKPFDKLKLSSSYVLKDGKIIVYTDEKLYGINISDATATVLAKDVKFNGGEIPGRLTLTDKGFTLQSSQNLMMIGFDGSRVFHTYYKAPGSSLFSKIASTTAIMAVNVASAADGYSRAMNNAYANGGSGSASYSLITGNPYMSKRFKATANGQSFMSMLTDVKSDAGNGPGLVKVNKLTGAASTQIVLGTKKPEYELDDVEGRLFFLSDDKKVDCFAF